MRMFGELYSRQLRDFPDSSAALFVSNKQRFHEYKHENFPVIGNDQILTEWNLLGDLPETVDPEYLATLESRYGEEFPLFRSIVSDRRYLLSPRSSYVQDYCRRFDDDYLTRVICHFFYNVEEFFDRFKPDLVLGFICVTLLDYVTYQVAKQRGVKVFNVRHTRVGNRVVAEPTLVDPSPEFSQAFQDMKHSSAVEALRHEIDALLATYSGGDTKYEGTVAPSKKPIHVPKSGFRESLLNKLGKHFKSMLFDDRNDPYYIPRFDEFLNRRLLSPLRARAMFHKFKEELVREEDLGALKYAFFPLHTEPEVSLLVYGFPYLNQLELIRIIAMSLPLDCVLLVKEHPWMVGKRKNSYYRKLLNIPRVKLVSPEIKAREVIVNSEIVTVISGSVAIEAMCRRKPVVTFGDSLVDVMPSHMVVHCKDLRSLHLDFNQLKKTYAYSEEDVFAFFATLLTRSCGINMYSNLLDKKDGHVPREQSKHDDAEALFALILKNYQDGQVGFGPN